MWLKIVNYYQQSDKYLLIPFLCSAFLVLAILTLFANFYSSLPPRLPLYYSLPWGEPQLVGKQQFIILPVILILLCTVNTFIASQLHPAQLVLKRTLGVSLLLIGFIIAISVIKVLFIFV